MGCAQLGPGGPCHRRGTDWFSFGVQPRRGGDPLPVFTFRVWLAALIVAVILLLVLSSFAFRGAPWMRLLSYPFAVLMLFNGLGHLIGSFYLRQPMPGVYSAPLLLAGSIWLILTARQNRQAGMPVLN